MTADDRPTSIATTSPSEPRARGPIILCADDFAISEGVSAGIEALADERRLSATSALVTLPTWAAHSVRLARLRSQLALGLHLNLTLGAPLSAMPKLAPQGRLPALNGLIKRALLGRLDVAEIAREIDRQLDHFEQATGTTPDFVDGHQHAHVLPGVRTALLRVLQMRYPATTPDRRALLVRDPGDRVSAIVARGTEPVKALVIAALAIGFGGAVRRAGFATNSGFSGVSSFDEQRAFADELARFLSRPGARHLVMCHPGFPDAGLAALDPHTHRRRQEFDALMAADGLVEAIWHVDRRQAGEPIWPALIAPRGAG